MTDDERRTRNLVLAIFGERALSTDTGDLLHVDSATSTALTP